MQLSLVQEERPLSLGTGEASFEAGGDASLASDAAFFSSTSLMLPTVSTSLTAATMSARLVVAAPDAPSSCSSTSVRKVELRWLFVSAALVALAASLRVTTSSSSCSALGTGSVLGSLLAATNGS